MAPNRDDSEETTEEKPEATRKAKKNAVPFPRSRDIIKARQAAGRMKPNQPKSMKAFIDLAKEFASKV